MKKGSSILSLAVCSALMMAACSGSGDAPENAAAVREAINVEVASVGTKSLDALSTVSGKLAPYEEVAVSFEIGGRLAVASVEVGDAVTSGNVIAQLDDADLRLQLEQAENSVLQAESSVIASSSSVYSAQASIDAAAARINSANANLQSVEEGAREQEKEQARLSVQQAELSYNKLKTDLDRIKTLYDQGIASQKDYEDMKLQVDNAAQQVEMAKQAYSLITSGATNAQRSQAMASIEEAQVSKKQAEASVGQAEASKGQAEVSYQQALIGKEQAETALNKAKLVSPISGIILSKAANTGEQVGSAQAIYTIGSTDQLKVLLPISDKNIKNWNVNDEVQVSLYDETRVGTVSKIYPATNDGSGTVNVEVLIPNEGRDWLPGQVVKASLITTGNTGILVPVSSVLSTGSDPYVFKVVDGLAVKTSVEIGSLVDNEIHIINGLEEGEQIVVRGGELLLDGDPVETGGGTEE